MRGPRKTPIMNLSSGLEMRQGRCADLPVMLQECCVSASITYAARGRGLALTPEARLTPDNQSKAAISTGDDMRQSMKVWPVPRSGDGGDRRDTPCVRYQPVPRLLWLRPSILRALM